MIYILRTLWALFGIPVYLITCLAFALGFIAYPFIGCIYYIFHGSTDRMKFEVDTMSMYIEKKWNKVGKLIEKQK